MGGTRKGGPEENTRFSGRDDYSSRSDNFRGGDREREREREASPRDRDRERRKRSRSRDRDRDRRRRSRSRDRKRDKEGSLFADEIIFLTYLQNKPNFLSFTNLTLTKKKQWLQNASQ